MKVSQINELFGIPHSTYKDWNKQGHKREFLVKYLKNLDYEKAKKEISKLKQKELDI